MLRVVLPGATATPGATGNIRAPINVRVSIDVRVSIEVVVLVNADVLVTPPAPPAPTSAPRRPHGHANAKSESDPSGVIRRWRIVNWRVRIGRLPVYHHGVVCRHIHNLWIGLFDDNYGPALFHFGGHSLLLCRFQRTFVGRFLTHALDGIHDGALLRKKRVTEIGCPLDVIA
jgi:hypothetical protein